MILADTSVWIDHFRHHNPRLAQLLLDGDILMHAFVLGEIACGNLKSRQAILNDLGRLPPAIPADNNEALSFLDKHQLFGKGLSLVDIHLLASALLSSCRLWTLDRDLAAAATHLQIHHSAKN
jgi:hypothetical protein